MTIATVQSNSITDTLSELNNTTSKVDISQVELSESNNKSTGIFESILEATITPINKLSQRIVEGVATMDNDPKKMLSLQNDIREYVTWFTVVSKVTGSTSKGCNELLHPQ